MPVSDFGSSVVDVTMAPGDGVLSAIGGTPTVRLGRMFPNSGFSFYGKLEGANPGGSAKDRVALSMLSGKIADGTLEPLRSVVVESSSGNLAIGIAQICRMFDIRFVCVVDANTSQQNIAVLRAYGAEVDIVTSSDDGSGNYLAARIQRVQELVRSIAHAYWPNQYANPLNPRAHLETMREVAESLDGKVDHLFVATSSFGTISGCREFIRANGLKTSVIAVDAEGSAIFGSRPRARLIPGHGAAVRPGLYQDGVADEVVHVNDLDCVVGCRRLMAKEAIFAGGSSGAVVTAVDRRSARIEKESNVVAIFPDRGERYIDTIFNDSWVHKNFGDVEHLWKVG